MQHNAGEIGSALADHSVTPNIFKGVFSTDKVPAYFEDIPAACVINTDKSDRPGKHLIAVYQDSLELIELFDSFGKRSQYHGLALDLFSNKKLIQQENQLQSDLSTVCGQYAMFLILLVVRDIL